MNKKEQEQIKEVLTLTYPVKLSYNSKAGLVIAFQSETHAYSILNYNRKRKNPILFDQWVRIIVDNEKKRVWIRVTDEDPEISFNLQYDAVEKLELHKTGYKIKFNTSQDELQEYYERRDV